MNGFERRTLNSFVAGAGLGLLAGLLCASRSGKGIRDQLQRGADDGLAYLREEAGKVRAHADSWRSRLRTYFCRSTGPDGSMTICAEGMKTDV
jgi:gas vesicle protein